MTAAAVFVFPVFELPTPTGAYDVGTEVFHFVDVEREEIFTDTVDVKRALMIQVWYPAYNTLGTTSALFSVNNNYETEKGNRDLMGKVLTEDVSFVLNQFEKINSGHILSKLNGKVDIAHVGTIGHSIGGATAYDAAFDERITAGVNLDGGLYLINANEGLNKPFLFM